MAAQQLVIVEAQRSHQAVDAAAQQFVVALAVPLMVRPTPALGRWRRRQSGDQRRRRRGPRHRRRRSRRGSGGHRFQRLVFGRLRLHQQLHRRPERVARLSAQVKKSKRIGNGFNGTIMENASSEETKKTT